MDFKIFSLLFILGYTATSIDANCVLPLPRFRFFAPLIFSSDGTLLPTDNNDEHSLKITIPTGNRVVLSCAPNYFKKSEFNASKTMSATCKNDQTFDINGADKFWMPDLGCEVRSVEEILKPITGCTGDKSIEFGYENPIKRKTLILGEACYAEDEGRTIFVHTKHVNIDRKRNVILKTEDVNYLAQSHPDSKYKIDFLVAARIDELNQRLERLAIEKLPFLEPRHFINMQSLPNGQLYSILKLGWNFAVTNGFDHLPNYDALMEDIMSVQDNDFDLYLGTHSTLSLKDKNSNNVDIYLLPADKKYPVPKYLWAVVATDRKAAAFFISNNIDSNEDELLKSGPCESKCTQMSWLTNLSIKDAYRKPKNGYVWCCDVSATGEILGMPKLNGKYSLLI